MQIKRRKLWCVLMSMIIILSGMYLEQSKSDAAALCAAVEASSHISTANSAIAPNLPCTNQILGIRGNIVTTHAMIRTMNKKGDAKISLDSLCENFFAQKERSFYTSLEGFTLLQKAQSNLVIKYIQNSDGKKRIATISL